MQSLVRLLQRPSGTLLSASIQVTGRAMSSLMMETRALSRMAGFIKWSELGAGRHDMAANISFTGIRILAILHQSFVPFVLMCPISTD